MTGSEVWEGTSQYCLCHAWDRQGATLHFRMFADSDTRILPWCRWTERKENGQGQLQGGTLTGKLPGGLLSHHFGF